MAFAAGTHWAVDTGGADGTTGHGGAFDISATFATDLAATSATGTAPVVTSASYNFIARDVGHWLFVKAGTNWTPGFYLIASVAANAATLTATIGAGVLLSTYAPTTAAGCATTASPTGGTWSIDYSQATTPGITYTDMVIDATTNTKYTSAAFPVGPHVVGNVVAVSSGTGFTVQRVQIVSVAAGVATCDKSLGTLSSTGGNGKLGGALDSPGQAGALMVGGNTLWIKAGTYLLTSASTNIASGCLSSPNGASATQSTRIYGFNSVRGDGGTKPVLTASGISTAVPVGLGANNYCENIEVNGASLTSIRGFNYIGVGTLCYRCRAVACTNNGFNLPSSNSNVALLCEATTCSTAAGFRGGTCIGCVSHANTIHGFEVTGCPIYCIAANNTGATTDGFQITAAMGNMVNCLSYNNGRHGVYNTATGIAIKQTLVNVIAVGNAGDGFTAVSAVDYFRLFNCAGYDNDGGNVGSIIPTINQFGFITLTADPFVNAAGNNFALNNAPGGGALLRAAGIPGATAANQFPALSTLNYLDVGAAQAQAAPFGQSTIIQGIGTY